MSLTIILNGVSRSDIFSPNGIAGLDVVDVSLEKEFDKRPSPEQIMQHPWVVGMQKLNVNMEKWIKEAWGWY
jgi:hypothetical protein